MTIDVQTRIRNICGCSVRQMDDFLRYLKGVGQSAHEIPDDEFDEIIQEAWLAFKQDCD
jgi:hypothetical protein